MIQSVSSLDSGYIHKYDWYAAENSNTAIVKKFKIDFEIVFGESIVQLFKKIFWRTKEIQKEDYKTTKQITQDNQRSHSKSLHNTSESKKCWNHAILYLHVSN